jgi:hypothetical protein
MVDLRYVPPTSPALRACSLLLLQVYVSAPWAVDSTIASTSVPSIPHVDTCGVCFPRLMSDADALEQPAASMISASGTVPSFGRISRRNSSGS